MDPNLENEQTHGPVIYEDDKRQLEEAIKRSLHITNLEQSELSEAVAASLRSHDEEVALAIYREDCAKVGQQHASSQNINDALTYNQPFPSSSSSSTSSADCVYTSLGRTSDAHGIDEYDTQRQDWTIVRNFKKRNRIESAPGSSIAAASNCIERPVVKSGSCESCDVNQSTTACDRGNEAEDRKQPVNQSSSIKLTVEEHREVDLGMKCPDSKIEVVIDGQNVGCAYGNSKGRRGVPSCNCFSSRGVELALKHFCDRGIRPIAFLPRRKVSRQNTDGAGLSFLANDPELLERLAGSSLVAFTPSNTHDDYFIINYAVKHELDLVSNDRFRKEVDQQESWDQRTQLEHFLHKHLIPFTFVGDEFVPNPNPLRLVSQDYHGRELR